MLSDRPRDARIRYYHVHTCDTRARDYPEALNTLYLILGIGLLTAGGELLIRGAMGAAHHFRVSPLLSGLVIVGFGTSMPELVVSVDAALNHQPDIALGNVVGSNIANVLLILGLCAIITPLAVSRLALQRDTFTVIAATMLFIFLAAGDTLSRPDGLILLAGLASYITWAYWTERSAATPAAQMHATEANDVGHVPQSIGAAALATMAGLALLIGGSRLLLVGAVGMARDFGVSEALIGLTLVAVGTSLPELTVSVIAAIRRHGDVAVGNILGSNIFNVLGILGVSALVQPLTVSGRLESFDQWVMLGVAVLLLVFLYTGRRLSRMEGVTLVACYALYVGASFALVQA